MLYGLRTKPGGELAIKLLKLSPKGAILGQVDLSRPIPVGRYPFALAQLCWAGSRLIVLVAAQGDHPATATSSAQPAMYSIEPVSGLCRLVAKN